MPDKIRLVDVSKSYGDQLILDHFNLTVKADEFLTLLGPSGCGKTTTLRIIGGFEIPNQGKVYVNDKDITNVPPNLRKINTVFQHYSLFPHLNVRDNVAFGLKLKGVSKKLAGPKADEMLKIMGLEGFGDRTIDQLSGGQQQRVAIARALINEPEILLLDEPLGALDAKLRKTMQIELKEIQKKTGITFIFVTHDQEEALSMSDRIVVMSEGKIQQIGSPMEIYNEPINRFVASFIGQSNIYEGKMTGPYEVSFLGHKFRCIQNDFQINEPVDIVIRPEDMELVPPEDGMVQARVLDHSFKGVYYVMRLDIQGKVSLSQSTKLAKENSQVGIVIDPENIQIMHKTDSNESASVPDQSLH